MGSAVKLIVRRLTPTGERYMRRRARSGKACSIVLTDCVGMEAMNQEPFGWYDVLPRSLAISQIAWERYQCAVRMRDLGLTYDQIGTRLNVSRERARQMVKAGIRRKRPPVWNYFLGTTELVREAYLLD